LTRKVYQVFDPAPLRATQTDLYVDLDPVRGSPNAVAHLANRILLSNKPTCQIIAGHRGCGKSTELRRLQRSLTEKCLFVVYCEADEDIDRNDVDFPEVLVAVIRQVAKQLREQQGISLKPGYFRDRFDRLKKFFGSEVSLDQIDLETGLATLALTVKNSPDARMEIRKLLEPDTANLVRAANDVIGQAKAELLAKKYRDLVIIVDDLDKMVNRPLKEANCSTAEYLFVHREGQLTAFGCHLVYTMPISLAYSAQEQAIATLYGGHPEVVPMTKLSGRPPGREPHPDGLAKFAEIIRKRLATVPALTEDVFASPEVMGELIRLSGGQPRELMILIRDAIIANGLPIVAAAVERAARDGRQAYGRQLQAEHMPILDNVRKDGKLVRDSTNDELVRELLESRAILQYENADEWYDVNPLVPPPPKPDLPHKPPRKKQ
jgi:hypothetical protein